MRNCPDSDVDPTPSPTLRDNSANHVTLKTQETGPMVCSYKRLTMTVLDLLNLSVC